MNLQRLERCLLASSRCHFAAFAGACVGEPHRRPTQAVDGRAGIRRDVGSLPIHARTKHCRHHELRRVEAARVGWAITAVAGFVLIPWAVGLSLGGLYFRYAHLAVLQKILGGLSSAAAGLMIATEIRLLAPHRARRTALLFTLLAFAGVIVLNLPLLVVLLGLAPISIAAPGIEHARAQ